MRHACILILRPKANVRPRRLCGHGHGYGITVIHPVKRRHHSRRVCGWKWSCCWIVNHGSRASNCFRLGVVCSCWILNCKTIRFGVAASFGHSGWACLDFQHCWQVRLIPWRLPSASRFPIVTTNCSVSSKSCAQDSIGSVRGCVVQIGAIGWKPRAQVRRQLLWQSHVVSSRGGLCCVGGAVGAF